MLFTELAQPQNEQRNAKALQRRAGCVHQILSADDVGWMGDL